MATLKPVTMPKWGIEMTEGTIAQWNVEEGQPYKKGDLIVLVETDKITNEIEAEADGCLVRLVGRPEETYKVGALIAVEGPVGTPASDIDAFVSSFQPAETSTGDDDGEGHKKTAERSGGKAETAPQPKRGVPEDANISPAARRAAEAMGMAVADIAGSGRDGRITRQDIDKAGLGSGQAALRGPIEAAGQEEAFASPLARRIAVLNGIDLSSLKGTGPKGRICKADVLALTDGKCEAEAETAPVPLAPAAPPPAEGVHVTRMSSMRKTIARRLTEAKRDIPHIYLRRRARMDRLLTLRENNGKPGTINDYLIRACALALREVPAVNVQVHGDEIHSFAQADIAVAVATDRGLITPILKAADDLGIAEISQQMAALAQRARAGKLKPEEFQGGSFALSNLGAYGVEEFDAIINPPQGAILAVGAARPEPIDDNGGIRIVPVLHLSLSCDHRAIDGVDGARFLAALTALIETPEHL